MLLGGPNRSVLIPENVHLETNLIQLLHREAIDPHSRTPAIENFQIQSLMNLCEDSNFPLPDRW